MKYMKTLFLCAVLICSTGFQNNPNQQLKYFAQVQLKGISPTLQHEIENSIKNNPNCFVVRLDPITNGLLIITKELNSFSENDLISWMEGNENAIECARIGVQGFDDHFAFDDDFCNKVNP